MNTSPVSVFSMEGSAWIVQNARDISMPKPRLAEVPFCGPFQSWASESWQADEYIYRCYAIPMLTQVPYYPVFVPYTLTAPVESDTAAVSAAAGLRNDAVPDEPLLWDIATPFSTFVAVPIDTESVAPEFASPDQLSAGLTCSVPPSVSLAQAVARFVDYT